MSNPNQSAALHQLLDEALHNETRPANVWAVYSRVSIFDSGQPGYSMEVQPDVSESYARKQGAQRVEYYDDPGLTGGNSKRTGLQRLIRAVKAGEVDVVVIHRIDRLYRNLSSLLAFIKILKQNRVRLVSTMEGDINEQSWDFLTVLVLARMAELFLYQTSANTRLALKKRAEQGKHRGKLSLGYCNGLCSTCTDAHGDGYCPLAGKTDRVESKRGSIAVPHPIDRHLIPAIFDAYLEGQSFRDIATWLNTHSLTLPDGSEHRYHPRKKGEFSPDSIRSILENIFYAGEIPIYPRGVFSTEDDVEHPEKIRAPRPEGNRRKPLERHPGQHEALISLSTFQAADNLRHQKGKTPVNAHRPASPYPLTGVAFCWECREETGEDVRLRGTSAKGRLYYRCSRLQNLSPSQISRSQKRISTLKPESHPQRPPRTLSAQALEQAVERYILPLKMSQDCMDLTLAYYLSEDGMAGFEREIYNQRERMKRVDLMFKNGDMDESEYQKEVTTYLGQLEKQRPRSHPDAQKVLPLLSNFATLWRSMLPGEKRKLLQIIFAGLYFDHEGKLREATLHGFFNRLLPRPAEE